MSDEKIKITLPAVPHKKGLSIYFGADLENGGFGFSCRKGLLSIKLCYVVLRIALWSEGKYNCIITMSTLQKDQTVVYSMEKF